MQRIMCGVICCYFILGTAVADEPRPAFVVIDKHQGLTDQKPKAPGDQKPKTLSDDVTCPKWPYISFSGGWVLYYCHVYPNAESACNDDPQAGYIYTNASIPYPCNCGVPSTEETGCCANFNCDGCRPLTREIFPGLDEKFRLDQDLPLRTTQHNGCFAEVLRAQQFKFLKFTPSSGPEVKAIVYRLEIDCPKAKHLDRVYVAFECEVPTGGFPEEPTSISCQPISDGDSHVFRGTFCQNGHELPVLVLTAKR